MLDRTLDFLDPFIAEALFALAFAYFGPFLKVFFVSKKSQDDLHRALETGVDTITDKLASLVEGARVSGPEDMDQLEARVNGLVEEVVQYTQESVPGAIKHLKPTTSLLRKMARAKLMTRTGIFLRRAL